MKFISWNVNGLRACVQKGFTELFSGSGCGYFLYSGEQSCRKDRLIWTLRGIMQYWNYAEEKRLFRDSNFYQSRNHCQCKLWNWNRGA